MCSSIKISCFLGPFQYLIFLLSIKKLRRFIAENLFLESVVVFQLLYAMRAPFYFGHHGIVISGLNFIFLSFITSQSEIDCKIIDKKSHDLPQTEKIA
jgi:hypothetical protein